ncbi:MAG TPA: crossover junction endodeoxyribonuclease RuvC [Candidatus Onthenecus intestinigallinarum]|uniref:Crossover junction endodeoxyribonuclease RuvC n=1 Tax=Candidatus Onthenecus intestinigallinarum TaxID=2840875 RepID=A0A9D0ZBS3_9FIRM|nr:crossover junction endodeoxyribonuclease RuvC [Candidatus Onthenecus intestinigallinarum]
MTILGIDPGLATLGWGVVEQAGSRLRLVQYGVLSTRPGVSMPHRLRSIYIGMQQLIETYRPDDIAFEELFFSKNVTTGMAVSAARGVALVAAAEKTDNLYEYTPMQIKQAVVGYGKAEKQQVQQMVRMLLGMKEIARPDDAADALAVAITHAHTGAARAQFKIK